MRRVLVALAVAAAGVAALFSLGAGDTDGYKVKVVFDNSDFIVTGQDFKIAGAKVGTITDVSLTADRHAEIEAVVDTPGFAPFRENADCTVQLQSLIGERFVECFPGSTPAKALETDEDGAAVVPLENTHSPVALDLVLSTFRAPAPERLALLLSSLGAGTAGRGDDLNAVIRRAAPALQQSQRVLGELNRNRDQLRSLASDGNAVLAQLDEQRDSLESFIADTGDLSGTLADRRAALAQTVRELPGLLETLNPYLETVSRIATDTQPTLASLDRAAEPLDGLLTQLERTSEQVRPALPALADTADALRRTAPEARPVVRELARFARSALPASRLTSQLLNSLHQQGAVEGIQRFLYFATAATARFDGVSHILGAYPVLGTCALYATETQPGCSANFPGRETSAGATPATRQTTARRAPDRRQAPQATGTAPAAAAPVPAAAAPAPGQPAAPLLPLLDQVLGGVQGQAGAEPPRGTAPVGDLLDLLLRP